MGSLPGWAAVRARVYPVAADGAAQFLPKNARHLRPGKTNGVAADGHPVTMA